MEISYMAGMDDITCGAPETFEPVPMWPDKPADAHPPASAEPPLEQDLEAMGVDSADNACSFMPQTEVPRQHNARAQDAMLADHLRTGHSGLTPQQYRIMVLEDALHTWPQPISPQLLRARLAGFKAELTDNNFRLEPCACCAREKKPAKLQRVSFPPPDSLACPSWLLFTEEEWQKHRVEWHEQVDRLLNVKEYL